MANYWRFENISPHQFECFTHFQTWKPKWTTGFWLLPPVSATNGVMFDASQEDLCHELPGLLVDFRSRHRLDTSISARFGWYPMDETSNFFEMVSIYIYTYIYMHIYICIYIYIHGISLDIHQFHPVTRGLHDFWGDFFFRWGTAHSSCDPYHPSRWLGARKSSEVSQVMGVSQVTG